ncbi:MAG: ABC transporter permease, partial [Chloroflexota bacterium]
MTRILGIAWRVLKTNFSEPKVIVPMLLFPIAFTFIFGVLMLGGVNKPADSAPARLALGFTAEEQTPLALALRDELMRSAALKVREVDEETARAQVKDGKIIAGVVVPEGFAASLLAGDHPRVTLIRQDQSNLYLTASGEVERSIQRLASAVVAADMATADRSSTEWQDAFSQTLASWHEPGRDIEVVPVTRPSSGNTVSQGNITSIGFCVMFIMLSVLISAGVVLEERVAGTWQRLLATPARKVEVILGYLLGFFINGWAQMAILMVATRYLFGVRWGDPVG